MKNVNVTLEDIEAERTTVATIDTRIRKPGLFDIIRDLIEGRDSTLWVLQTS